MTKRTEEDRRASLMRIAAHDDRQCLSPAPPPNQGRQNMKRSPIRER